MKKDVIIRLDEEILAKAQKRADQDNRSRKKTLEMIIEKELLK